MMDTRKQIEMGRCRQFWMLKKWSSYAVWDRSAKAFDEFVKAYEEAVATWPEGEAPPEYNLRFAYEVQEMFALGLPLLRKGDRSVWLERDGGYLYRAESAAFNAMDGVTCERSNRETGGEHGQPYYPVWTPRLEQLRLLKEKALISGASHVCERTASYSDWKPTAYFDHEFDQWAIDDNAEFNSQYDGRVPLICPETPLPTSVLIESGERVTHDGIWEQVVPGLAPGQTVALNYFVKGAQAPWIDVFNEADGPGQQTTQATSWRLIWEDTRYRDGMIPDESEYLKDYSAEPEPVIPSVPATVEPQTGRVGANQPCPQAGYWWTPAKENSRHYFDRGEAMPDFPDSSYGATIWYWDQQQG